MTQIDLPQISLARYFDLLKRRRWQVIPVTLLGLLIGGLVAFLIPRYYVAEVLMQHNKPPTEDMAASEDPFVVAVDNVKFTLPLAVGETMKKLGWQEAFDPDEVDVRAAEREVQKRIEVQDKNPGRNRSYAQIRVTYRDRDGKRAADFLNMLVTTWVSQRLEDLRKRAEEVRRTAAQRQMMAIQVHQGFSQDVHNLERKYGFTPDLPDSLQWARTEDRAKKQDQLEQRLRQETNAVAALRADVEHLQANLDKLPRTVPPSAALIDEEANPALYRVVQELAQEELFMQYTGPKHPNWRGRKLRIEQLKQELLRLQGIDGNPAGEVTNPAIQRAQEEIDKKKRELTGKELDLAGLTKEVAASRESAEQSMAAYESYRQLRQSLEEARQHRNRAQTAVDDANDVLAKLNSQQTIQLFDSATIPPAPTEPNVFVVAAIGMILGLGTAIGLILLIDFLQGTFKTVDEVERALAVPVLGGMSHLETEEQRVRAAHGRRRTSLLAGTFVLAVVALVTIYYVDSTRLPVLARDLLALFLGN